MYPKLLEALSTLKEQIAVLSNSLEAKTQNFEADKVKLEQQIEATETPATSSKNKKLSLSRTSKSSTSSSPLNNSPTATLALTRNKLQATINLRNLLQEYVHDIGEIQQLDSKDTDKINEKLSLLLWRINYITAFSSKNNVAPPLFETPEFTLGLDVTLHEMWPEGTMPSIVGMPEKQMFEYKRFLYFVRNTIVSLTSDQLSDEFFALQENVIIESALSNLIQLYSTGSELRSIQRISDSQFDPSKFEPSLNSNLALEWEIAYRQRIVKTLFDVTGRDAKGFQTLKSAFEKLIAVLQIKLKNEKIEPIVKKANDSIQAIEEFLSRLLTSQIEETSSIMMKSFTTIISPNLIVIMGSIVQDLKQESLYENFNSEEKIKIRNLVAEIISSHASFMEALGEIRILHHDAWKYRELEQLKTESSHANSAIAANLVLSAQLEARNTQIQTLEQSLGDAQRELVRTQNEGNKRKAELQNKLDAVKGELSKSHDTQRENLTKIRQLEQLVQKLQAEIDRLRAKDIAPAPAPAPTRLASRAEDEIVAAPSQQQADNTVFSIAIPKAVRENTAWTKALGHTKRQNEVRNGRDPVLRFFTQTQFSTQKSALLQLLDETIEAQTPVSAQWWLELEVQAMSKSGEGRFAGAFDESPLHASQTKTQFYEAYNAWREAAAVSLQLEIAKRANKAKTL